MKANTGMNFFGFFALLQNVVDFRTALIRKHQILITNLKPINIPDCTDCEQRNILISVLIGSFKKYLDNNSKFDSETLKNDCLKTVIDLIAILCVLSDVIKVFKKVFNHQASNEKSESYKNSLDLFKTVALTLNKILQYIISNSLNS